MIRFVRAPAALIALVALVACAGRDYRTPVAQTAAAWPSAVVASPVDAATNDATTNDDAWWRAFADPSLDALVAEAFAASPTIAQARAAVREARAVAGVADAQNGPTLDGRAEADRFAARRLPFPADQQPHTALIARFDAGWEVDFSGAVARGREAASADVAVAEWSLADARCALAAEIVRAYADAAAARRRADLARRGERCWEQTRRLVAARAAAGLADGLAVAATDAALERARAATPALAQAEATAITRLAVLRGRDPASPAARAVAIAATATPPALPLGVPADLLRCRPDIRRAERALAAASARIGVAEGDLYPRLRLDGRIGLGAENVADLVDRRAALWSFGPSLAWNLFDAGATRQRVAAARARADEALAAWRGAVIAAEGEVLDAAAALAAARGRRDPLATAASAAVAAWRTAEARRAAGEGDGLAALAAARDALALQDEVALAQRDVVHATAALAKALGHGWSAAETRPVDAAASADGARADSADAEGIARGR